MRTRMVTRTVEEAVATVMVVDVTTQKVSMEEVKISATIPQEKVCKYLEKNNAEPNKKYVAVTAYTVSETLYGMSEEDFIRLAKILPPRSGKAEDEE